MASVLVVDDDLAVRDLICEALRDRGLIAEAAANDMAAYRRITSLPTINALVLDVNLGPGTTGYDVARFARRVIPEVAVIYVSGAVPPSSAKAYGVPGGEFIQKPFSATDLAEVVTAKTRH